MRRSEFMAWPHHPGHPEVVVPVRCDPSGRRGPTPGAARGPTWRWVAAGWYVPAWVDRDLPAQRIAEAAVRMPAHAAVTGWAGLHWAGAPWFTGRSGAGPLPVTLAVGDNDVRPVDGVMISNERLLCDDIVVVDGLRVTTAVRSTLFEMRYAATDAHAVAALDMAAFGDLVSLREAASYAAALRSCTGVPRARRAIAAGNENAWSPAEVALRLTWTDLFGLPAPHTNRPIFDLQGNHLLTPDLLDEVNAVACEYDGVDAHLTRAGKARDVERDATYRRLGIELVVMTADDRRDLGPLERRARAAYARSSSGQRGARAWTIDPPPWWKPTLTVEQRRTLPPEDRRRLLGHRWS